MIRMEGVSKSYDGGRTDAVCELTLEVRRGETLVLLGSSGCGKTTSLKMINRLVEPTGGRVLVDGTDVMETDPIALRRRIGYAVQHVGLFPHMTVAQNVSVVPGSLKKTRGDIDARVDLLLNMMGLEPSEFRGRYPSQLSGGQRQRVGVARSLAADPPIILMDEPFGALDPITREQLQGEFLELESEIQKTVVFVTHDVFEAVRMGDRIALLDEGKLQQLTTPAELVEHPANDFVERFLGQHRFQLSLLTRPVRSVMPEGDAGEAPASRPETFIPARGSLIEALDLFKKTGLATIPVYRRQEFLGHLRKKDLLTLIAQVLGETGSGGC